MHNKTNIFNPLKIGLLSFFFILSSATYASTYYVDSVKGNDNNGGTTEDQAWKTVTKISAHSFQPGDVITFKKNQTFNGRLSLTSLNGTDNNPITFTSYGSGANPIISTLTTVRWSDWTQVTTNIYKRTSSPIIRLGENGTEILKARKINYSTFAKVDSVADPLDSQFRWHHNDSSTLYLYSKINPNNSTFTYSGNSKTISVNDSSYLVVDGIHVKGGGAGIFIADSSHITIKNCNMGEYSTYGIQLNKGSNIRTNNHIIIDSNIVDSTLNAFDYSNAEPYARSSARGPSDGIQVEDAIDSEVKHNYVKNWCHTSLQLISFGGTVESNKIYNNTFTAPNLPYGGRIAVDYANYNEFHHNLIIDTAVVSQLNGHSNYYHHNYFDGTRDSPLKSGNQGFGIEFYAYGSADVYDNRIEYNTIINCEGAGLAFTATGSSSKRVENQQIKNNIFYNNGRMPRYSSGSYQNIGIMIQQYIDIKGQIFINNAIAHPETTKVIGLDGSMTVDEFNAANGTGAHTISGNINLYPEESSTTYGAGPRENVGAGGRYVPSQISVVSVVQEAGAFIMDRSGLH